MMHPDDLQLLRSLSEPDGRQFLYDQMTGGPDPDPENKPDPEPEAGEEHEDDPEPEPAA